MTTLTVYATDGYYGSASQGWSAAATNGWARAQSQWTVAGDTRNVILFHFDVTALPANAIGTGTVTVKTTDGTGGSSSTRPTTPSPWMMQVLRVTSSYASPPLYGSEPPATLITTFAPTVAASTSQTVSLGAIVSTWAAGAGYGLKFDWEAQADAIATWYIWDSSRAGTTDDPFITLTYTLAGSASFLYTGSQRTFTVPASVNRITMECWGAEGRSTPPNSSFSPPHVQSVNKPGGLGAYARSVIDVTPGETLYIYVGGSGVPYTSDGIAGTGYNGGQSQGGGGGTDVRRGGSAIANRVVVAGGGGAAGYHGSMTVGNTDPYNYPGAAGAGGTSGNGGGSGGASGGSIYNIYGYGGTGGLPGTSSAGGGGGSAGSGTPQVTSGYGGNAGSLGQGGAGGGGGGSAGGGGGGGYYGGGGGGGGGRGYRDANPGSYGYGAGGGGAGGSSLANAAVSDGVRSGDGLAILTYTAAPSVPGAIVTPVAGTIYGNEITISCGASSTDTDTSTASLTYQAEYSADGTTGWTVIGTSAPGSPTVIWNTSSIAAGTTYKVRMIAGDGFNVGLGYVTSGFFSITHGGGWGKVPI